MVDKACCEESPLKGLAAPEAQEARGVRGLMRRQRELREPLVHGTHVQKAKGHADIVAGGALTLVDTRQPEEVLRRGPIDAQDVDAHA